jgi:hypothetical protein
VPAQAKPEGETSRIPGLLEAKVKVGEMVPFSPFTALALNDMVLPICSERLTAGLSVILAGKGEVAAGFLPPQAGNRTNSDAATVIQND